MVPVPPGEKGCKLPEWEKLRIKADEVEEYFVGEPNVGVLLGKPRAGSPISTSTAKRPSR